MGCVESVVVSGCRGNVLECTGRSKLWNASVLECNLENTLEITFGTFQVLQFLEYPYFLIGTRFGTPLFRNAPGNPTGRSKIWNAPVLECLFWNAPLGKPLRNIVWDVWSVHFLECP